MSQQKIVYECAERDAAHRAASLLQELLIPTPDALTIFEVREDGGSGEVKNWRIESYFNNTEDTGHLVETMAMCLDVSANNFTPESIPDNNWVALSQAALPPVEAGRYTIYGSHDQHRVARGPNSILIDAGEAFGTAHHATTYGCLLAIDHVTRTSSVQNALDLGCGSAVLSIALARAKPNASIIASDLDPQSVIVAANNVRQNGAHTHITTVTAAGLNHPQLRARTPFDLIIANILAAPLLTLAAEIAGASQIGGKLILSGILNTQASEVQARYLAHGFQVCSKMKLHGWTTLTLSRAL